MDLFNIPSDFDQLRDPFASFDLPEENIDNNSAGLKCELKTYEARYNVRGERLALQVNTRRVIEEDEGRDLESGFLVTRFYDKDKALEQTLLEVKSPHAKAALRSVISKYPGVNFHAKRVVLVDTPKCVFHYRKELEVYKDTLNNSDACDHILFLLEYMNRSLRTQILDWSNLMESPLIPPGLYFEDLWMAFRPGSLLYTRLEGGDRIFQLMQMIRCMCPDPHCEKRKWLVKVKHITCDGTDFGYVHRELHIHPYDGYLPLNWLNVYPLEYHIDYLSISRTLLERGQKFVSLQGIHHQSYNGLADVMPSSRSPLSTSDIPTSSTVINSRIMIDTKMLGLVKPSSKIYLHSIMDPTAAQNKLQPNFSNDNYMICDRTVPGFCFTNKEWYMFDVELIGNVNFNTKAFESLLLPPEQKSMIHSLVKIHANDGNSFDDIMKGKGKGMIFLLHGVPGVGKTLTAESVADHTSRPLYTLSSGELGVDTTQAEQNLTRALRLATSWKAIVLIDEADVFMEQRTNSDLKRNSLVSIFLRLLEYFEGLLILTTNRIGAFDPAFKSRIHLAIKYNPLTKAFRRDLWCAFVIRASKDIWPDWMDNACLDQLSVPEINGRQIKNIVRTAQALSLSSGEPIGLKQIHMALTAMELFERDFDQDIAVNGNSAIRESRSKRQRIEDSWESD